MAKKSPTYQSVGFPDPATATDAEIANWLKQVTHVFGKTGPIKGLAESGGLQALGTVVGGPQSSFQQQQNSVMTALKEAQSLYPISSDIRFSPGGTVPGDNAFYAQSLFQALGGKDPSTMTPAEQRALISEYGTKGIKNEVGEEKAASKYLKMTIAAIAAMGAAGALAPAGATSSAAANPLAVAGGGSTIAAPAAAAPAGVGTTLAGTGTVGGIETLTFTAPAAAGGGGALLAPSIAAGAPITAASFGSPHMMLQPGTPGGPVPNSANPLASPVTAESFLAPKPPMLMLQPGTAGGPAAGPSFTDSIITSGLSPTYTAPAGTVLGAPPPGTGTAATTAAGKAKELVKDNAVDIALAAATLLGGGSRLGGSLSDSRGGTSPVPVPSTPTRQDPTAAARESQLFQRRKYRGGYGRGDTILTHGLGRANVFAPTLLGL